MTEQAYVDIQAILERVKSEAYEQGKADAKREMLQLLSDGSNAAAPTTPAATSVSSAPPTTVDKPRSRAPRGLVAKLIAKAIRNAPDPNMGLTPAQITEAAETEDEKMIKVSSVRGELRRRENVLYREDSGRWVLIGNDESDVEAPGYGLTTLAPRASDWSEPTAEGREAVPGGGPL